MLVQVTAPHFCAGIILKDGIVTEAAPILRWAIGWRRARLSEYFREKGWKAIVVNERRTDRAAATTRPGAP